MKRSRLSAERMRRLAAVAACVLGLAVIAAAPVKAACRAGDEACPVVLKMKRGATSVTGTGSVSGERPNFYFKFDAMSWQKLTVHVVGRNLKTGAGIPLKLPSGGDDAVDEDAPYTLPETGSYVIEIHANTMSDGPFGPFRITLTIK